MGTIKQHFVQVSYCEREEAHCGVHLLFVDYVSSDGSIGGTWRTKKFECDDLKD